MGIKKPSSYYSPHIHRASGRSGYRFFPLTHVVSDSTLLLILSHSRHTHTYAHTHTLCCILECFSTFHLSESDPFFKVFPHEVCQIVAFDFILSPTYSFHLRRHFLPNTDVNSLRARTVSGRFFVFPTLTSTVLDMQSVLGKCLLD